MSAPTPAPASSVPASPAPRRGRLAAGIVIGLALLLVAGMLRPPPAPKGFNLADFASLPVLVNGRFKPLDTVGRTSLLQLRSKQSVTFEEQRYSGAYWLLEVMARPEKTDQMPLFVIDNPDIVGLLHQRQEGRYFTHRTLEPYLDRLQQEYQAGLQLEARERTPFQMAVIQLYSNLLLYHQLKNSLRPEPADDVLVEFGEYREVLPLGLAAMKAPGGNANPAVGKLMAFVQRYQVLDKLAYFRAVPPAKGGGVPDDWRNVGQALLAGISERELAPGLHHLSSIMQAWRRQDAAAFNTAVTEYRTRLASEQPAVMQRMNTEQLFNRTQPFYLALSVYFFVFMAYAAGWLLRLPAIRGAATWVLLAALLIQTGGLILRVFIQGYAPVTNLYSSAVFVGWVAVILGACLERWFRNGIAGSLAAFIGFATLIIAHHLSFQGDTMEMMRAVLDSNFWLSTHVTTITIGYAGVFLAGFLAIAYIVLGTLTRWLDGDLARAFTRMVYGVICFSTLFSFVGTVLGGIWADQSWGRFWGWDPKENGALLIVMWCAVILHARWGGFIRQRGLMVLAVVGNMITAFSWFGVNLLGVGLHAYGFTDKGFVSLAIFMASQIVIIAIGLLPLAWWRSATVMNAPRVPREAAAPAGLGTPV